MEFPKELGLPGRIASRNITPDLETGLGAWTDGEKIRAIREGISRDGTMLFPMMPYERFRKMSDEDVMSLVAYLNTLTPVRHRVKRSQVDFPVSILMRSAPRPAGCAAARPVRPPPLRRLPRRPRRLRRMPHGVREGSPKPGSPSPAANASPFPAPSS